MADTMCQDAILMRLQDIGESLCHLRDTCPDFWDTHAQANWIRAVGLRNIISHAYGEVDLEIIWILVSEELTDFKESVQKLL